MNRPQVKTSAVILAGGRGTRIRHLLSDRPKPMAEIAGRPFLDWVLRYWEREGLTHFLLATGYQASWIEEYVATRPLSETHCHCVQETSPLNTAGAFFHAVSQSPWQAESWIVCNGDSLLLTGGLADALQVSSAQPACIVATEVPDTSRYGRLSFDGACRLRAFEEKKPGLGWINAGIYALHGSLLSRFETGKTFSFEHDVFPQLLQDQVPIRVQPCTGAFLDIGTPASLAQATAFIQSHPTFF